MEKFKDKYRIHSNRMPGWDYARGGKYYVTICTGNRICCLGDVMNGKMHLSAMGKIARQLWLEIPEHFANTWLDEFIVMPNHIHGIIVMKRSYLINDGHTTNGDNGNGRNEPNERYVERHVETPNLGVSTFPKKQTYPEKPPTSIIPTKKPPIPNWKPGSLGVIINQFKRICTITIKRHGDFFAWQPRFYDEIIRSDKRLEQIRAYIRNNPAKWDMDDKNPKYIKP